MITITKTKVQELINTATINGKSEKIEVAAKDMNYFRSLISQHNKLNGSKFKISKAYGVYREVYAPFDRFFDLPEWKAAFDLIQKVLYNDKTTINPNQLELINNKLNVITLKCVNQCVQNAPGSVNTDKLAQDNSSKKKDLSTNKSKSVLS